MSAVSEVSAQARSVRRGLPRVAGGPSWPDVDAPTPVAPWASGGPASEGLGSRGGVDAGGFGDGAVEAVSEVPGSSEAVVPPASPSAGPTVLRQGLPRVSGGEGWPEAGPAPDGARFTGLGAAAGIGADAGVAAVSAPAEAPTGAPVSPDSPVSPVPSVSPGAPVAAVAADGPCARRGLPRAKGAEPWPRAGTLAPETARRTAPASAVPVSVSVSVPVSVPVATAPVGGAGQVDGSATANPVPVMTSAEASAALAAPAADVTSARTDTRADAPARTAATPSGTPAPRPKKEAAAEAKRYGKYTARQWVGVGVLGLLGTLTVAGILVLAARGLTTFQGVRDFLARYPGEYHLPDSAPVGFPAWVGWQHFLNMFLMVLIIRSGLQVRRQERPPAFWTRKARAGGAPGKKISLTLWLHQSLDVLWMVNGLVFVVLLFATGQWMRVIPTSWEVFPNALSAALQYATLQWPVENGWVNYNSLQQLAYGLTIFVAAPLAALSGWRMSGLWPSKATKLTQAYKVEWARAVHFPVMIYFVGFIAVHVILVVSTGVLRNLNHMFAANDGNGWAGFWFFAGSLVVIAGAVAAARPLVLAPIAKLFGTVSAR